MLLDEFFAHHKLEHTHLPTNTMAPTGRDETLLTFHISEPCDDLRGIAFPDGVRRLILRNIGLVSFVGCPEGVVQIDASGNKLTGFDGIAASVTILDISRNAFVSLVGAPPNLKQLRCSNNRIDSLAGLPDGLESLGCSYTHITNWVGCPGSVKSIVGVNTLAESFLGCPSEMDRFYCSYNCISDWTGCPVARILDVSCNLLTRLDGCPSGVQELCAAGNRFECLYGLTPSVSILRIADCDLSNLDALNEREFLILECGKNFLVDSQIKSLKAREVVAPCQRGKRVLWSPHKK